MPDLESYVNSSFGPPRRNEQQDWLVEARQNLARFEATSIDLARLPDSPEVQEEADIAAWHAAGQLRRALTEVERLKRERDDLALRLADMAVSYADARADLAGER